tara:strand:- start:674 stop:1054 length:381 start_codon:yes stop_codon:yes gene_type:complete
MKYSKYPKGLKYNLYLYHNDVFIGKYGLMHNDINRLIKEYTQSFLVDAFRRGVSMKGQIRQLTEYCDKIAQMRNDCYKVKMSDLILFMNTAFCLYRYNKKSFNDFIILKKRNNKKVKKLITPIYST